MPIYFLCYFFTFILINGCFLSNENLKGSFNKEYKVLDRGNLDVILSTTACAVSKEEALIAAERNASYHLRSIIGDKNYHEEFELVRMYKKDNKICIEMRIKAIPPL